MAAVLGFVLLLSTRTAAAQPQQQQPEIVPAAATRPALREVTYRDVTAVVAHIRATQRDLAAYQLVNRATGAVMRVYYEPALNNLAAEHLPYLAWMIDQVAREAQADAGQVIWHSVVFTTNRDYIPPRGGNETRWPVVASADGRLSAQNEDTLFGVIPHEQVHAVQDTMHPRMPRWFKEGHASWIGLRITAQIRPEYASRQWREQQEALADVEGPLDLAAWGGLIVRSEAIYRQVSTEDQSRMDSDPSFTPSGSFSFRAEDMMDEVDQAPRYAASLRLFEEVSRLVGHEAMARWQRGIWADPGPMDTSRILALSREYLDQDLTNWLR